MVFLHCKERVSVEPKHCGENPICSVAMRFESMFGSRRLESYAIIVLSEKVHSHCTFTLVAGAGSLHPLLGLITQLHLVRC